MAMRHEWGPPHKETPVTPVERTGRPVKRSGRRWSEIILTALAAVVISAAIGTREQQVQASPAKPVHPNRIYGLAIRLHSPQVHPHQAQNGADKDLLAAANTALREAGLDKPVACTDVRLNDIGRVIVTLKSGEQLVQPLQHTNWDGKSEMPTKVKLRYEVDLASPKFDHEHLAGFIFEPTAKK